jgi:hypothetical protein
MSNKILEESHSVVIFPYDNVSNEKLKDFLKEKLSSEQAQSIIKTSFKKFDFLNINVNGKSSSLRLLNLK